MLNFCYMIVVACSIYHVSSAGKLTRQCKESNGKCGVTTDVSCNRMFGRGWVEKGKCCNSRPCCVEFQCEDIAILNGKVTQNGTSIGSTATYSCDTGYELRGSKSITCTGNGWSNYPPFCYACPVSTVHFKGSTYKFQCESTDTWLQAEANCNRQGGNLTSIETVEENNYLKYVANLIPGFWWIGLSDIKTEGSFQWTSGQQLNFTDWYQGPPIQPDDKDEFGSASNADCVVLNLVYSYQWTDASCRIIGVKAICEI